jgi:hypothetical protein
MLFAGAACLVLLGGTIVIVFTPKSHRNRWYVGGQRASERSEHNEGVPFCGGSGLLSERAQRSRALLRQKQARSKKACPSAAEAGSREKILCFCGRSWLAVSSAAEAGSLCLLRRKLALGVFCGRIWLAQRAQRKHVLLQRNRATHLDSNYLLRSHANSSLARAGTGTGSGRRAPSTSSGGSRPVRLHGTPTRLTSSACSCSSGSSRRTSTRTP